MPRGDHALAKRFRSAIGAVQGGWWHAGLRPPRLSAEDLARYRKHDPAAGWRFEYPFSDRIRRIDIIVSAGFPSVPARIAVVDRPRFLTWPHVEKDGVLCLVPDHATFSVDDPYAGVSVLLDKAIKLIEGFVRGEHEDDFKSEFLTYWDHAKKGTERTILSLVEPAPPSRTIRVWEGRSHIVLADDDGQLQRWLKNFNSALYSADMVSRGGVLVWLETPLLLPVSQSSKGRLRARRRCRRRRSARRTFARGRSSPVRRAWRLDRTRSGNRHDGRQPTRNRSRQGSARQRISSFSGA